jgi:hypothetical protein
MIVHINHVQPGRAVLTSGVVSTLLSLLENGEIDAAILGHLNVHLDWVQYKTNFREPVIVRRATKSEGLLPMVELAVDLRQVHQETLRDELAEALDAATTTALADAKRVALEPFRALRSSIIWEFNRLYWQYLSLWEKASGRTYEKALPGGKSDGHHPAAISDSVGDFWTLLKDLDGQNQLPPEVFVLEIGVGSGERARRWLDRFLELDRERGTHYYPRLRFLLADYAKATLNRAMETLRAHRELASFLVVDALDPFSSLSFLRYKVLYIHLSNVYDNLPTDELVIRDGRFYFVEVRSYTHATDVARVCETFGVPLNEFTRTVKRLIEVGPEHFPQIDEGLAFWQAVWRALRLEERLIAIDSLSDAPLPSGMRPSHVESLIGDAPTNLRFQLSSGAVESFINTIPLLHPRGYLQVQDIFVTRLSDYAHSFRGPGKLDGSVVNWVNGALLAEVGEQAGYDVHFAPFRYREGSRTSILYTTHRE